MKYISLEWVDDPRQKAQMIDTMVAQLPKFSPGWKEHALLQVKPDDKLASIEKGLAANPDAETKGLLEINKALALNELGKTDEAVKVLGTVALDPKTTLANEHLVKQVLSSIIE